MKVEVQKWVDRSKESVTTCIKQKELASRRMSPIIWGPEKGGAKARPTNIYWPREKKVKAESPRVGVW